MAKTSAIPTMDICHEARIDFDNCVMIPGMTLQILRKESMLGQHVIVIRGGKKGVKKIYHDLHTGILGENSSRLPFKILDRSGANNSETTEG